MITMIIYVFISIAGWQVSTDIDEDGIPETVKMEILHMEEDEFFKTFEYSLIIEDEGEKITIFTDGYGEIMENLFPQMLTDKLLVNGRLKNIVIVKTVCSGTGIHSYGRLVIYLDGEYMDFNVDGYSGIYKNRYIILTWRHDNLGCYGIASPFLPHFYVLEKINKNWMLSDSTFEVLLKNEEVKKQWISGVSFAINELNNKEHIFKEDIIHKLQLFKKALEEEKNALNLRTLYTKFFEMGD